MKTTLFGCVLSALMLASCSSEQNVTESVRLSDIVNTGCTRSFSAKESRPEYYRSEMEKKPQVSVSVDKNGVATFKFTDLEANCIVNEFRPSVKTNDGEIAIVLIPYTPDPTVEADCYCRYDVGFKLSLHKMDVWCHICHNNPTHKFSCSICPLTIKVPSTYILYVDGTYCFDYMV